MQAPALRQAGRTKSLEGAVFRSLTEIQKGATFYVITLGLAVLLALFGPTGTDAIQTINMFTATAGVLLMLLGSTPGGYPWAGWGTSLCTAPAFATGFLPCSRQWLSWSRLRRCDSNVAERADRSMPDEPFS